MGQVLDRTDLRGKARRPAWRVATETYPEVEPGTKVGGDTEALSPEAGPRSPIWTRLVGAVPRALMGRGSTWRAHLRRLARCGPLIPALRWPNAAEGRGAQR